MELEPMEQGLEPMEQAAARDRSPLLRPQREPEVVAGEPERRSSGREAVLGARRQRQVSDLHHYKQLRRQHLSSLAQIASISHPNGRRGAEPAVRSRWGAHDGLAFVLLATTLAPYVTLAGKTYHGPWIRGKDVDGVALLLMMGMTLPLQLVAFLLHLLVGPSLWSNVPAKLPVHDLRRCFVSGRPSKLCCCRNDRDPHDYERTARALPNWRMWLHFVLFTCNVLISWPGDPSDTVCVTANPAGPDGHTCSLPWACYQELRTSLSSPGVLLKVAFYHSLGMWCAVQLRKGVLAVNTTPTELKKFALWCGQVAGVIMILQVWLLLKFWVYLMHAVAMRELSGDGGGGGGSGSDVRVQVQVTLYDDVGGVLAGVWGALVFSAWCLPWLVGARKLGSRVDDR
jgi:hypothetical protein